MTVSPNRPGNWHKSTGKAIVVMKPGPSAGMMSYEQPIFYDSEGYFRAHHSGAKTYVELETGSVLRHVFVNQYHVAKDLTPHRRIKRYQRAYHVDQILPVPWNSYGYTVSLDRFPYG